MVNFHGREWSLYYDQESVEGTSDVSATYLALAHHAELKISQSPSPVAVAKSGDVDFTTFQKGVGNVMASVNFNPSGANGLAFIKNFASTDNPHTLVAKAGSTFQVLRGCKVRSITVSGNLFPEHGPVEATAEIMAWTVNGTEPTTPAYESIPSSFVNWSDVAITLGGLGVTDWWNFTMNITNDLFRMRDNAGLTTAIHRGRRDVTGSVTRSVIDNSVTDFNDARDATSKALIFNFVSSSAVFTLNAGAYTDVEVTHPITGMSGKKLDLKASTLTIA